MQEVIEFLECVVGGDWNVNSQEILEQTGIEGKFKMPVRVNHVAYHDDAYILIRNKTYTVTADQLVRSSILDYQVRKYIESGTTIYEVDSASQGGLVGRDARIGNVFALDGEKQVALIFQPTSWRTLSQNQVE